MTRTQFDSRSAATRSVYEVGYAHPDNGGGTRFVRHGTAVYPSVPAALRAAALLPQENLEIWRVILRGKPGEPVGSSAVYSNAPDGIGNPIPRPFPDAAA